MNYGRDHVSISLRCTPFLSVGAGLLEEGERVISIAPTRTPIHIISGKLIAYREQLPVLSSYDITVHRSQSLSLQGVAIGFRGEVNSRWNPIGKVYVALSRCTSISGLWVKGLRNINISVSTPDLRLMKGVEIIRKMMPNRVTSKQRTEHMLYELEICNPVRSIKRQRTTYYMQHCNYNGNAQDKKKENIIEWT